MLQGQVGQAALVVGLGVVGGQLDDLVEPRQGLVGLVPGELERGDPEDDRGRDRVELQAPEVGRQRLVGSAQRLEHAALGEVGLGLVRVDLDGVLEPLQSGFRPAELRLDLAQADQGPDVLGVELQARR